MQQARYDQRAKQLLEKALAPLGQVTRRFPVTPAPLYVSTLFTPHPKGADGRPQPGPMGETGRAERGAGTGAKAPGRPEDDLGTRILEKALEPLGTVQRNVELIPEPFFVDFWFRPDPAAEGEWERLGLLAELGRETCLIETFYRSPAAHDLYEGMFQQLELRRTLAGPEPEEEGYEEDEELDEEEEEEEEEEAGVWADDLPVLWFLTVRKPSAELCSSCGFKPSAGLPAGFYQIAVGFRVRLLAVAELPRRRDTLPLRLLGTGNTLQQALADLAELPPDSWEAWLLLPLLAEWRREIEKLEPAQRTADEKRIVGSGQLLGEGDEQGAQRGGWRAWQTAEHATRPLTDDEAKKLSEQLGEVERIAPKHGSES